MQPPARQETSGSSWQRAALFAIVATAVAVAVIAAGRLIPRDAAREVTGSAAPSAVSPLPSATVGSGLPTVAPSPVASSEATPAAIEGWTPVVIAGMPWVTAIAERDGRVVAIGSNQAEFRQALIAYSDDGRSWTSIDTSHLQLDGVQLGWVVAGVPGFVAGGGRTAPDYSFEDVYLFSSDGKSWQVAEPPEECAGAHPQAIGSGFVAIGAMCVIDGAAPPGPARVVTSVDGRSWVSRLDSGISPGRFATDGKRIVMLTCCTPDDRAGVAISDDGATSWRQVPGAFPAGISLSGGLSYGHHRYIAIGSWLIRAGDPDHALCTSDTGETWDCSVLPQTSFPARVGALNPVTTTPTGYASLEWTSNDPTEPSGSTTLLGTSTDGLTWTFTVVPAMTDLGPATFVSTRYGLFAWGGSYLGPETPYLMINPGPLP